MAIAQNRYDRAEYARRLVAGRCAAHGCSADAEEGYTLCITHRKRAAKYAQNGRDAHPEREMVRQARKRAKKQGVPCTIRPTDVIIPKLCPVLGIELARGGGAGGAHDASPSLDRFRPSEGYVIGNIRVISYRANRIKNDATVDEIQKVADWMRRQNV